MTEKKYTADGVKHLVAPAKMKKDEVAKYLAEKLNEAYDEGITDERARTIDLIREIGLAASPSPYLSDHGRVEEINKIVARFKGELEKHDASPA